MGKDNIDAKRQAKTSKKQLIQTKKTSYNSFKNQGTRIYKELLRITTKRLNCKKRTSDIKM